MTKPTDFAQLGLSSAVVAALQTEFENTPNLLQAQVYGSRAKGNYRTGSDIDIAVFGINLSPTQLLALETRLDDLLLPYQIDLCHFDTLQNPALIDHIQRVGLTIYSRV